MPARANAAGGKPRGTLLGFSGKSGTFVVASGPIADALSDDGDVGSAQSGTEPTPWLWEGADGLDRSIGRCKRVGGDCSASRGWNAVWAATVAFH